MLCVGLDPDPEKIPSHLANDPEAIFRFCAEIVDATADVVCAFKPQIAYFSAIGAEQQLEKLCAHIRQQHPHDCAKKLSRLQISVQQPRSRLKAEFASWDSTTN